MESHFLRRLTVTVAVVNSLRSWQLFQFTFLFWTKTQGFVHQWASAPNFLWRFQICVRASVLERNLERCLRLTLSASPIKSFLTLEQTSPSFYQISLPFFLSLSSLHFVSQLPLYSQLLWFPLYYQQSLLTCSDLILLKQIEYPLHC